MKTAIGIDSNITLFCRNWQAGSKIHRKCKGTRITKTTLKNDKVGEWTLPDFNTDYKAAIIKIVWHGH